MSGKLKKTIIGIVTVFIIAMGSFAAQAAEAGEERVLTVAFPETEGMNEVYEDGTYGGMVYDWLMEIAKYTGWKYEFVTGDPSVLLTEMMSGKYDLMGGMFFQEELTDYFCYPKYSMGSNYTLLLYPRDDDSIKTFDLSTLNGKKIGVLRKATAKIDRLEKFLSMNGLTCTFQYYDDDEGYENCLENGETDLMLGSDVYMKDDYNVAAKYPSNSLYLVTAKDEPEVCDKLSAAMTEIYAANPDFAQELYDKYFPERYINSINFSDADSSFIAQAGPVRVAVVTDSAPFYARKDGEAHGIVVDMLDLISQRTGLTFEYVEGTSYREILSMARDGKADLIGAFMDDEINAKNQGLVLTREYTSLDEVILRNKQTAYPSGGLKLAYPEGRKIPDGVEEADVYWLSSYDACFSAVNSGKADYTRIPAACLEGLYLQGNYANLMLTAVDNLETGLSFALPRPLNVGLYSVLSKAVNNISGEEVDNILTRNMNVGAENRITLKSLFYANPIAAVGVCASFVILIMLIILLAYRYKMKSRIMALKLEKAEETARVKTEFLSRMSHEIRTPMNAIIGLTNLALMSDDTSGPTREKLKKIDTSAGFLLHLINDVLDMTKIGNSKMQIEHRRFDLEKLMEELRNIFEYQVQEKETSFTLNYAVEDSVLTGDAMRLKQILVNLLSNACKFTERRGNIVLTVRELARTGERAKIYFCVRDDGQGIPGEDMERIFQNFEQSEAGIANGGGTGLGLPISKSLVELMGGELKAESVPGVETKFYFTLELEINHEPPQEADSDGKKKSGEDYSFENHCFLIAEDNDLNAEIAVSLLEMKGGRVDRAVNGDEAVQMFLGHPAGYYSLILMDLKMPVKDGLTAAREIRAAARADGSTIPIIAMTANTFSEDREDAVRAGMDGFLPKPFNLQNLYSVLEQYLEQS